MRTGDWMNTQVDLGRRNEIQVDTLPKDDRRWKLALSNALKRVY